jgi:GST-like protein
MAYDLYAAATANGLRATVMLEELGADYALHPVDLLAGEHRAPEFLALNPNGQIPVLIDSDGPNGRLVLDQSIAIMIYLAEKHEKFLPENGAGRVRFVQAIVNIASDIGPTVGSIFAIVRAPEPHKPSQEIFEKRLANYFGVWDRHFADARFAAGEALTLADFAFYPIYARVGQVIPHLQEGHDNLARWAAEIGARPGTMRGMNVFG